ncbi:MAG: hypothetical protein A2Y65_03085 [Deltaproteobacteria bacterium RBG_13_52_11]|nr:MAG: hypothetical protein A2Y65_03085 [Deltaproteobacteria bacterium RBG_13_52_11]
MKKKLLKFFNAIKSRNGEYLNELRNDHEFFKREITNNLEGMTKRLYKHYKYFSLDYVKRIIGHFKDDALLSNPWCMRYIESEFLILNNQIDLIKRLKLNGFDLKNRTVLEIGCANGCLLFACSKSGAKKLVGIDISQTRLKNAREFLGEKLLKKKVELLLIDIFSQDLPYDKSSFEVIFSTNVLEHVQSTHDYFGRIKKYLSDKTEGCFALTSVCNKYNISSILAEPHYGIPGLILLNRKEASNIWYSERKKLFSNLDYEVFDWFLYEEYQNIAFSQGLETFPLLDKYSVDSIDAHLKNYKDFADKYYIMAIDKLTNLCLIKSNNDILAGAIKKYFDEFIKDHTEEEVTPQRKVYLYLKYYAFVLEIITMHKSDSLQSASFSPG